MSGMNTRIAHYGSSSTNGSVPPQVMTWQRPDYLRPVTFGTTKGSHSDALMLAAAHPALGKLTEQDRCALLRGSRYRTVKRREVICHQGDTASAVILVMDGYLKRSTLLPDGKDALLGLVGPGECAEELSVLLERPHDANVTAISECRLLMIEARQYRLAFEHEAEGLLVVMRLAAEQLHRITEQLLDGRARSTSARLAKALLDLPRLPSSDSRGATMPRLRFSQSELGAMAGICRELVNKQLAIWRGAGWIKMSGGAVTSFDLTALSNLLPGETLAESGIAAASRDYRDQWLEQRVKTA